MKLTQQQKAFLESANECTPPHPRAVRHEFSGRSAKGATLKCAATLERLGLVEYIGHGLAEDEDSSETPERPIYAITDAGRAALSESAGSR